MMSNSACKSVLLNSAQSLVDRQILQSSTICTICRIYLKQVVFLDRKYSKKKYTK